MLLIVVTKSPAAWGRVCGWWGKCARVQMMGQASQCDSGKECEVQLSNLTQVLISCLSDHRLALYHNLETQSRD